MNVFARLWNDQDGFIVTLEMILIATVTGLGLIVGLTIVRDALVSELSDLAAVIESMDLTGEGDGNGNNGNGNGNGSIQSDNCISFELAPSDEV